MKGLEGIHPKEFTRTSPKTWQDKFLGMFFSGLDFWTRRLLAKQISIELFSDLTQELLVV